MYSYIKSPYWKHLATSAVLAGIIGYIMKSARCFSVPELIAIEFARTPDELLAMIRPYQASPCHALYNNTLLDFGFMAAYSLVFYFSGRIICDLLELSARKWLLFLWLPLVLDAVENLLLLHIIGKGADTWSFTGFYYAVRLKWLFVIPAALLSVTVALYQFYVGVDKLYCWRIKEK